MSFRSAISRPKSCNLGSEGRQKAIWDAGCGQGGVGKRLWSQQNPISRFNTPSAPQAGAADLRRLRDNRPRPVVRTYIDTYVCIYVYMYMLINIYTYIYIYICIRIHIYKQIYVNILRSYTHTQIHIIYIYMYIYVYIYIYIYVCIYIYIATYRTHSNIYIERENM